MIDKKEIYNLHRRQTRSKFVIILIVGFLTLLTFSLIALSRQIAQIENQDIRSRASESELLPNSDVILPATDPKHCFNNIDYNCLSINSLNTGSGIGGAPGRINECKEYKDIDCLIWFNGFNPEFTKPICNGEFPNSSSWHVLYERFVFDYLSRIESKLKSLYGDSIRCNNEYSKQNGNGLAYCFSTEHSCPAWLDAIKPILDEFCAEADGVCQITPGAPRLPTLSP